MQSKTISLVIVLMACASLSGYAQETLTVNNSLLKIIDAVNVPAERSGALSTVNVVEGSIVKSGEVIAMIRDSQAKLKLEQAEADLELAKRKTQDDIDVRLATSSLQVAEAEYRRAEKSKQKLNELVSDAEMDRLELLVKKATLEIERAESEMKNHRLNEEVKANDVELSQEDLQRHQIVAPIDGMIVGVERKAGEWVNVSDTVARIVRIDRLRVEGLLDAEKAIRVQRGDKVTVKVQIGDDATEEIPGELVFVSPEAIPGTGKLRVWAEIENKDLRLRPGLNATMDVLLDSDS